jgi:hypothetical protein
VTAILVGGLKCLTQFWKGTTQGSFQQSLVEIGSVVSEEKIFKKFHPPFFLFLAWRPSWLEVRITGHNFGRGPSKDHSTKVWLQLAQWFLRRRLKCDMLTDRWWTKSDGNSSHGLKANWGKKLADIVYSMSIQIKWKVWGWQKLNYYKNFKFNVNKIFLHYTYTGVIRYFEPHGILNPLISNQETVEGSIYHDWGSKYCDVNLTMGSKYHTVY